MIVSVMLVFMLMFEFMLFVDIFFRVIVRGDNVNRAVMVAMVFALPVVIAVVLMNNVFIRLPMDFDFRGLRRVIRLDIGFGAGG